MSELISSNYPVILPDKGVQIPSTAPVYTVTPQIVAPPYEYPESVAIASKRRQPYVISGAVTLTGTYNGYLTQALGSGYITQDCLLKNVVISARMYRYSAIGAVTYPTRIRIKILRGDITGSALMIWISEITLHADYYDNGGTPTYASWTGYDNISVNDLPLYTNDYVEIGFYNNFNDLELQAFGAVNLMPFR